MKKYNLLKILNDISENRNRLNKNNYLNCVYFIDKKIEIEENQEKYFEKESYRIEIIDKNILFFKKKEKNSEEKNIFELETLVTKCNALLNQIETQLDENNSLLTKIINIKK